MKGEACGEELSIGVGLLIAVKKWKKGPSAC